MCMQRVILIFVQLSRLSVFAQSFTGGLSAPHLGKSVIRSTPSSIPFRHLMYICKPADDKEIWQREDLDGPILAVTTHIGVWHMAVMHSV
ncbi:hypothetical protein V8F06_005090 [Rhypophila decipiens]